MHTVKSEILARVLFSRKSFMKKKPREMARSFSCLLMEVNNPLVAIFKRRNYVFDAFRENKILSEFTVYNEYQILVCLAYKLSLVKLCCEMTDVFLYKMSCAAI